MTCAIANLATTGTIHCRRQNTFNQKITIYNIDLIAFYSVVVRLLEV